MNNPRGRGRGRGRGGNQNQNQSASQDQRKPPPPAVSQESQPVTQNPTPAPTTQDDKIALLKARLKSKTPVADPATTQTTTAATPAEQTPTKPALKSDLLQLKLAALNKKTETSTPTPTPATTQPQTQAQAQKEESAQPAQPKIMTRSARANAGNTPAPTTGTETNTNLTQNVPEAKPIANRVITLNKNANKPGTVVGLNPNNRPTNPPLTNTAQTTIPAKPEAPKQQEAQKPEPPKPEAPKIESSKPAKDLPVPNQKNTVINLSGKPSAPQAEKVVPANQPQTQKVPEPVLGKPPVEPAATKPLRGESAPVKEPVFVAEKAATKEDPIEKAKSDKTKTDQLEIEEPAKEAKIEEETQAEAEPKAEAEAPAEEKEEEGEEEEEGGDMEEEKPEESAEKKVETTPVTEVQENKEKVSSPPSVSPQGTTTQVAPKTVEPTPSESLPSTQPKTQESTVMQEEQPAATKETAPEIEEEKAGEDEEEEIDLENEQLSTGSKKFKKNNGSPENISQGSPVSKSSTSSKLQLKQQKKDAERIQKSMNELEEMVSNMETKIPENLKHLVDYAQSVNKKRPFNKRLAKVIKFFESFQA